MIEIDAERPRLGQRLHDADIAGGDWRRVDIVKAGAERRAIAGEQFACLVRRIDQRQRAMQPVGPAADDVGDILFQPFARHVRCLAAGTADDEMHAHQRPFREERIESRHAADEGARQAIADLDADGAVVAFARHVNQHRHEPVEAVAARQHPHARPLVELQDRLREVVQRLVVDLEQFVARIMLQHIGQRLAGMTARIEPRALFDGGELAAQIGDAVRRARIGGRGEQADDAVFADKIAAGIETLDADIIEINAPVHARMDVRLGDDQRPRLVEKRHDLRRHLQRFAAAAQHLEIARAHDAEPRVEIGLDRPAIDRVIAHAEKGEIVGQQPLQELDRFGKFVHRQRRRIALEPGDDGLDTAAHRLPVLDGKADLCQHALERGDQC